MTNSAGNLSDEVILATGGYDHTIKLWQLNDGVCKHTAQHTDSVSFIYIVLSFSFNMLHLIAWLLL